MRAMMSDASDSDHDETLQGLYCAEREAHMILERSEPEGFGYHEPTVGPLLVADRALAEAMMTVVDLSTDALPGYLARCALEG